MKLNTVNLLVGLVIAVSGVFYLGTYIVDKTQYAIEIRLGDAVDTVTDPGLEFKVPFITRIFYVENRIQDFDADPGSVFTKDKKEMIVDTYSKWRVEDPLKFYQTVRTVSGALARLDDIIYSQTREILGKHTLVEIVSGNRKEIRETISINSRSCGPLGLAWVITGDFISASIKFISLKNLTSSAENITFNLFIKKFKKK